MADIWDDDIDVEDESELVKQLRAVIKAGKKANEELSAKVSSLEPEVRSTKLVKTLTKLGITNPKIAGLVPKDLEPTEDSVKAWVDEYGDLFGITANEGSGQSAQEDNSGASTGTPDVDSAAAAQWQKIQSQESQSGVTTPDQESAQIALLQAAAQAAKGNSDLFFSYLKGETEIPTS